MAEMALVRGLASMRFRWIYVTGAALILLIGVQETLSARGARIGGGFRSSSSRYSVRTSSNVRYTSQSTRVRVRYNNYRPWRSWHSYGSSGHIYGYVYYTHSRHYHLHKDQEPTICRNEYDNLMDNGTNYEWFICPNITSPDNYDACCGDEDRKYCCQRGSDGVRVFGIFVAVFILLLGIILTIYCCCCRKPPGRETYFQERFMSKRLTNGVPPVAAVHYRADAAGMSGNAAEITHLVNPPMQGPQSTFPQNDQPGYPPMPHPSTQPVYPPQPVPSPHGFANGNYPSPGGLGALPSYPPNPGAQPYPPASDQPPYPVKPSPPLSDGPGYPPSASAPPYTPYPIDGSSAPPYPPYQTDGSSAPPYPPYQTDGSSAPPYPPYQTDGSSAPPYPPYQTDGSSAPPYPPYQTDGSSAPPYPPYPVDGSSAAPYPLQPAVYNLPGYPPVSPPPTYSSLK